MFYFSPNVVITLIFYTFLDFYNCIAYSLIPIQYIIMVVVDLVKMLLAEFLPLTFK